MSHSHSVLLIRKVTESELREFVEEQGGQWQSDPVLPQGFIGCGDVWLFIRGVDNQEAGLREYTRAELAEAEQACGKKIVASLSIDHTKGIKGSELAKQIITEMLARWGGYHIDGEKV